MSSAAISLLVYGLAVAVVVALVIAILWILGRDDDYVPPPATPRVLEPPSEAGWPQLAGWHASLDGMIADWLTDDWAKPLSARDQREAELRETSLLLERAAALLDG